MLNGKGLCVTEGYSDLAVPALIYAPFLQFWSKIEGLRLGYKFGNGVWGAGLRGSKKWMG